MTGLPTRMKAAISTGPGAPLVVTEVPVPIAGQGQVLVKLESCGICHSDLHLRDETLPNDAYPRVFGHEGIGRVVAVGAGTFKAPTIGARVGLPWLYDTCLACKPCRSGLENYCPTQQARGVEQDGAFAEYAVLEARFACEIPDQIDPITGAPLLCAGLTAWSALKRSKLEAGQNVLIIGAGGLGQYAVLIAKARGARVIVVDQDPAKLQTAQNLGADLGILAGPEAGAAVRQAGGADVTLNFAPTPRVWQTIKDAVNPLSDIVAVALVDDPVDLSMLWLIDGGHRVYGSSVGTRQDLLDFLNFAAQNPLAVNVETVPLDQVNHALDRLQAGDVAGRLCVDFSL
ncbi:alcohol dehydrogenase catalytic domain-containing protein [Ruegeria lacuscaerulensis]|uniref:alcohol dehydrogenase catalytic domain-containing protein n=1 Tax=Ruegeria lacuscaerulensis TaxID=55218 RepID=UPI00147BDA9E|nr:alcohol dehydrogenase catalytic domain-containing protein [Ruegeria lacuscaerulensis]